MRLRKLLPFLLVVFSIIFAGCTTFTGNQNSTTPMTKTATANTPTEALGTPVNTITSTNATAHKTPTPSGLTPYTAKERAIDTEESYLSVQLRNASCLKDWGTAPTTQRKKATIVNRTEASVVVSVTHPYWYTTGSRNADGISKAKYLVTLNDTKRISGTDIQPC